MYQPTHLRLLRQRHGIRLRQLSRRAGISNQHLSRLELQEVAATPYQEQKLSAAFEKLIADSAVELEALRTDYTKWKGRLLESVAGDGYEL